MPPKKHSSRPVPFTSSDWQRWQINAPKAPKAPTQQPKPPKAGLNLPDVFSPMQQRGNAAILNAVKGIKQNIITAAELFGGKKK